MKAYVQSLLLALVFFNHVLFAADWPQWRHDAKRSGATEEELPGNLKRQWMLALGKPTPAYEHQYRMCADYSYSTVSADGTLFVPSNMTDQVIALDLDTGKLCWRYVTDGPVRFAPVYNKGKLYFTSDDAYLYCVDSKNGKLTWRQRGVPKDIPGMLMLVNGRMVSRWPARGAPVLSGGIIYFGAGIWPEEGVYQNAVDAETGELVWQSDALSLVKEGMCDHGTNHDLSLPPHGYPAIINNKLAVTSGRTLKAGSHLVTGEMFMDSSIDQKIVKKLIAGKTDYRIEKSTLYRISAPAGAADWTHESADLLTYRDAATELYDIDSDRTIPFNSMRAGCTTSFIPAGGVMSAPMLGHGCVCNYPMFASIALYHMPGSKSMRPKAVQQSWERK